MRYIYFVAATVFIVGTSLAGVVLSAYMIGAGAAKESRAAAPPPSIGVMTIMQGAKDLPVQEYDPI